MTGDSTKRLAHEEFAEESQTIVVIGRINSEPSIDVLDVDPRYYRETNSTATHLPVLRYDGISWAGYTGYT